MTVQKEKDLFIRILGVLGVTIGGFIANDVHQMRPDMIQLKSDVINIKDRSENHEKRITKIEGYFFIKPEEVKLWKPQR